MSLRDSQPRHVTEEILKLKIFETPMIAVIECATQYDARPRRVSGPTKDFTLIVVFHLTKTFYTLLWLCRGVILNCFVFV